MVDRNNLLDQLNKLPDSQWEELLFRLNVDQAHLRTGVTKNQHNIDLIRLFEPGDGLPRLQKALRELSFFKEFMPAGTYPLGDELLQREESREQQAMQAAATRGDDPEDYKITPELGSEAKQEARVLLTTPGQDPQVLCRCLDLLGPEAK